MSPNKKSKKDEKKAKEKATEKGKKDKQKKHAAASAAASASDAPTPAGFLLKAEGPTDRVALTLTWKGGEAALASLTDNGATVILGESQRVGTNILKLNWPSPDAFLHVLQWDLFFPGTRTELKATATVNGTGQFENPVGADSKKDRWSAAGTAEE
jgi:hypothetical protein